VNHAQESVARKFCKRKTPETVAEQNGNLGRNNRHAYINKQQNRCDPREQTDNQERTADYFDSSNERAHGVRRRNANLRKTARAEVGRIKKLLDPFCQNIPPTTIRTKIAQLELGSRAGGACSDSRSELREVVNPELLFDAGHFIDHFLKTILAEKVVLLLLKIFSQRIVFVPACDLAEFGKENRVLPRLTMV